MIESPVLRNEWLGVGSHITPRSPTSIHSIFIPQYNYNAIFDFRGCQKDFSRLKTAQSALRDPSLPALWTCEHHGTLIRCWSAIGKVINSHSPRNNSRFFCYFWFLWSHFVTFSHLLVGYKCVCITKVSCDDFEESSMKIHIWLIDPTQFIILIFIYTYIPVCIYISNHF